MTSKLDELLGRQPFAPFVITTEDGDSISIANPRKALVWNQMVVIADDGGRLHHIPFATISQSMVSINQIKTSDQRALRAGGGLVALVSR